MNISLMDGEVTPELFFSEEYYRMLDYIVTLCLFTIFTILVYIRRKTLTGFEFIFIVSLLCHVLVSLYRVRNGESLDVETERFVDSNFSGSGVTVEEEVVVEEEVSVVEEEYNALKNSLSWRTLGTLPQQIHKKVVPTLDDLVKGMTVGIEAEESEQDISLDVEYIQKRRDKFKHRPNQTSKTIAHIYKDANFALSEFKKLSYTSALLLDSIKKKIKPKTREEKEADKKLDDVENETPVDNIQESEQDKYHGGKRKPEGFEDEPSPPPDNISGDNASAG